MGVTRKIAWLAMWLIPFGFCFTLQASNTSNDSLGAFFILAAFFYALKARRTHNWNSVALSILAMALAGGVKANLVPFGFPWLIAIASTLRLLLTRPLATVALALLAATSSFLPISILCWKHGAGFTGFGYDTMLATPRAPVGLLGNCLEILVQNLWPPMTSQTVWSQQMIHGMQTSPLGRLLGIYFMPNWACHYQVIPVEQAGLGFVVVAGLILLFVVTRRRRQALGTGAAIIFPLRTAVIVAIWLVFLQFVWFSNSDQTARLTCVYYPLLAASLFAGRYFTSSVWFRFTQIGLACAAFFSLVFALTLSEGALSSCLPALEERGENDEASAAEIHSLIPASEKTIGVIRYWNQREAWVWQPFGTHTVIEFSAHDTANQIAANRVHYVVIYELQLETEKIPLAKWLQNHDGTLVGQSQNSGPLWYCVRLEIPVASTTSAYRD